jgi:hypothetical protein
MSRKLMGVINRLQKANETIREQQKEIERLKKLIEIMNKWGDKNDNAKTDN